MFENIITANNLLLQYAENADVAIRMERRET